MLRVAFTGWLCSALVLLLSIGCSETTNARDNNGGAGGAAGAAGDGGAGGFTSEGCQAGPADESYGSNMVGCNGAEFQCYAQDLCAPGWHLCTYSEYEKYGGLTTASSSIRWLASCVRKVGVDEVTCPDDAICTDGACGSTAGADLPVVLGCDNEVLEHRTDTPLGVTTAKDGVKMKAGCADAGCGFVDVRVQTEGEGVPTIGATCCKSE